MLGLSSGTDIQRSALLPAARPRSRASAVMFNAMAVADKCMIRIHYLVVVGGGLWGRGDEIPASKRACIYHGDRGCADGSRMTDFTDINQISVISIY